MTKPKSMPYLCGKKKTLKEFFFGAVTRFEWNSKEKVYEAKEEKSVFLCDHCSQCYVAPMFEFIGIDDIASESYSSRVRGEGRVRRAERRKAV